MADVKLTSKLDCLELSSHEINSKLEKLIFEGTSKTLLNNSSEKSDLLEGLKGNIKIEILGNVGDNFANKIEHLKVVVNGNVGNTSITDIKNSKLVIFGSCGSYCGHNIKSSEVYLLEGCGSNCFFKGLAGSKIIIGGQFGANFAPDCNDAIVIILNLKGGSIFIDDNWMKNYKNGFVYLRGNVKSAGERFLIENINDSDEDIFLPLISEFARLFSISMSEIKSKQFYKVRPR